MAQHIMVGDTIRAANGSEAAPSLSFSSATGTGLYATGGNTLRISSGGVNCVTISTTSITMGLPSAILGTTTNDNASTGYIGEYVEATIGTTSISTTNTGQDITSISLTAGDWDVSGGIYFTQNGATWTQQLVYIANGISGNSFTGSVIGLTTALNGCASSSTTPTNIYLSVPSVRISLSSTTTIYLKARVLFSAGTPQGEGAIHARRVR